MASLQVRLSSAVQSWFYRVFYAWGLLVAKKPKKVIGISFLVALLCSIRLLMAPKNPLPSETRQEKLFAPQDSQGVIDFARYQNTFGYGSRRNEIFFTTQPHGGNVLTSSVLSEVGRFDSMVRTDLSMNAYSDRGRSWTEYTQDYKFADLCLKAKGGTCFNTQNPLELFTKADGAFNFAWTDAEILAVVNSGKGIDPVLFPPAGNRTLDVDSMLGGIVRDAAGRIVSAQALKITYSLKQYDRDDEAQKKPLAWEDQLNYLIGSQWTNDPPQSKGAATGGTLSWSSSAVDIFPNTAGAISRELRKSITGDILSLNIGFMMIAAYAYFMLSKCRKPAQSRALLATAGLASCGIAIAIAYSMGALFRDVNQVINVLPFVLIGIGVDDMFVLVNALEALPANVPVEERLARAMASAGVSITITSLTDFFAFLLGSTSSLPGLASFCVFAAIGILADFILQITFFAGWMALDAYREAKAKADCCCCPCCPPTPVGEDKGCLKCCYTLAELNHKYYVPLLRNKAFKGVVLTAFVAFSGICLWQATKLQQDFQRRWFVNGDAQLQVTFDIDNMYYKDTGTGGLMVNIVTPPTSTFDYASVAGQQKLVALTAAVEASKWIEPGSVTSWYPQLRAWVHACIDTHVVGSGGAVSTCVGRDCMVNGAPLFGYCRQLKNKREADGTPLMSGGVPVVGATDLKAMVLADGTAAPDGTPLADAYLPPASFYAYLDQFTADSTIGTRLSSNFRWVQTNAGNLSASEAAQGVSATQMRAYYVYMNKAEEQVACMRELRTSVESAGVGTGTESYPFMFVYIFYEQFAIIRGEAFANLAFALIAVFLIVSLLVASVHASLMVILCVVMVDIDILGLMQMWGLTIDSVTIINLVLAIGLSVDYSAHVAHAFVVAKGTRQERADHAIAEMGTAVVHGALSTFAAVLVLSTSQSYIFRVFFKQFFGICIFGAAHGLLFLPVLLSLVGPAQIDVDGAERDVSRTISTSGPPGKMAPVTPPEPKAIEMMVEGSVAATPPTEKPPGSVPPSPPSSAHHGHRVMPAWEA